MFDLVIRNGKIVDGTGNNWFYGDLAVEGDRLAAIGWLGECEAGEVLDATDKVIAPGFLDIHCHSDMAVVRHPECRAKILQGVTTEVNGNCSFTPVPVTEKTREYWQARSYFIFGDLAQDWKTFDEYFSAIAGQGVSLNVSSMVGLGALRAAVMGAESRPPSADEMKAMKRLLTQALEEGALGLSTGLIFEPCAFASTDEIVELCGVLRQYDRLYVSHIRGERETSIQATQELIEIGERSGVPVHMSHLEAVDRPNWGKTEREIQRMLDARARGVDVSYDMYPYRGSPIRVFSIIPRWAAQGGYDDVKARLRDPATRRRIIAEANPQGWDKILVARFGGRTSDPTDPTDLTEGIAERSALGRSVADLAREHSKDPWDTVFDMFLADTSLILTQTDMLSETDLRVALSHPLGMIASDGTHDPDALLHPRLFGTFAEVLGKYVREERVLRLEEAIRKFTSAPAARLGLRDLGVLREDARAELTVFDPATIRSKSTYADPERHPEGIEYVIVSGKVVVRQGEHSGARPGRVIRK